ncbi:hypothetical protein GCM10007874_36260 [Labrys miyagiensis]|uniref:OmpA-like domain-containing protein n=1 Tax=Labrys miyagiensis TaxID=346912 RepID=A0ABQ6CPI4_9HYPH|nr:OmpA family protein [Labrys miyagiensis]GLS20609.1 hypothetical protein GCM10007874_36260 [Labrys miyagiensis]
MSLRKNLIGLVGTLMLAVSPTAIVLAQDTQTPTVEAPGKASPEDVIKRHKQKQQGAGDESQNPEGAPLKPRQGRQKPAAQDDAGGAPAAADDGAPVVKPKRQKPGAAEQDGAGAAPNAADEGAGAPAMKPKRQKPNAAQQDGAGAAPSAADEGAGAPAMKPKRQKPDATQQDGAGAAPNAADEGAGAPAIKPKRQTPAPAAETAAPATSEPAQNNAQPDNAQPDNGQQPGTGKPPRQKGQRPANEGQQGGASPAIGGEPQAQPDQQQGQGQGQGKHRDRTNQQGQPDTPQPEATPNTAGQPQNQGQKPGSQFLPGRQRPAGQGAAPGQDQGQDDGTQQGQGWRNRLPGQGNLPGQGSLPGQGNLPGQGGFQNQQQGGAMPQGQSDFVRAPVNPVAEQRALGLLNDPTPPDRLNNQQLRQRLDVYRGALAGGNLSPGTEQALIERLNGARAALRNRVSDQEYGGPQNAQNGRNSPFGRPQFQEGMPTTQDIPAILADRRPSNVLTIDQLNRRILVYRDASNDQRYSPDDRQAFARYLQDDRGELRRRLISDRGQRQDRLRRPDPGYRLDMDVAPRGPRQQSIWAAEVDDEEIEEQFASRPLRPLPRRYSRADFFAQPEMVMAQPTVRQAIPSVELDTIHFGFNESFIREEEMANLDRVGRILERIVAAHPNEVFVIEGNTDAVGDDAYNLRLSKERAEAVKQALTQYYVISPDNLATAGLGERYLKIPTPEPEQENRRVTIRRVTSLLEN